MGHIKNRTELNAVVRDYMTNYPLTFKRTLAAMIVADRPDLFNGVSHNDNIERVRGMIRQISGNHGSEHRIKIKDPIFLNTYSPDYEFIHKPNKSIDSGKALIISDVHGYNSVTAQTLYEYCQAGKEAGCDIIYLNGDIIDNEQLAKWQQLGKRQRLQQEYEWVQEFMSDLTDMFPNAKRYYKFGNHEFWWQRAIWNNPNVMSLDAAEEALRLEKILGVEDCGFEYLDYTQGMDLGKLTVWHGHEMKKGGQYVANAALNYYKKDVAFGHFHRVDKAKSTVYGGGNIYSYSLPCARILDASYTGNNNQWEKGFAICEFTKDDYEMLIYVDRDGKIKLY